MKMEISTDAMECFLYFRMYESYLAINILPDRRILE